MKKSVAGPLAAVTLAGGLALGVAPLASADMRYDGGGSQVFSGALSAVPTNHVTGSGTARIELEGNEATVTVDVSGLLGGVPHAMHIHVDGMGACPTAADARMHNGHLSLSTTDGHAAYGMIGTSLTTSGDTSPASGLAVTRFPTGSAFHYQRTMQVSDDVAASIRRDNAVIVVHGIDFDGSGKFTNVLGPSDLDPTLPMTATDPALCGAMRAAGHGGVAAGEGGTQTTATDTATMAAGAALALAGGASLALRRRRKASAGKA